MCSSPKNTRVLASLAQAAALVLPGTAAAEIQSDYLFAHYSEGDIARGDRQTGVSGERYEISSHLFSLLAPLGEGAAKLDLTYERMSGASPWYVMPGPDGKPLQAMSGASIHEERTAVAGSVSMPMTGLLATASLGYSSEDDYRAVHGGIEVEAGDEQSMLTWKAGIGYSADSVEPTQGNFPTGTRSDDRDALSAFGGASLVLDASTVAEASLSLERQSGYLSDPYKQAWIVANVSTVQDQRPDERLSYALNVRLRHYLKAADAAIHARYRYYSDDWNIHAHALEVAWHQAFGDDWRLVSALRWYSQSQARFYAPYYAERRGDGLASSDYRLSPYGAISARIDLSKEIRDLTLGIGAEYYEADADYALKKVDVANPGLVQFTSLQLRLRYLF